MAAYLKNPFSHNPLIARKPLIRVPVEIPVDDTGTVLNLLRHNDTTIRNIAATFLSNVVGSATRERVRGLMINDLLQVQSSDDQAFATMSARVFGGWLSRTDLDRNFQAALRRELVPVRDKLASREGLGAAVEHFNYLLSNQVR
jgi:hypothetical protein